MPLRLWLTIFIGACFPIGLPADAERLHCSVSEELPAGSLVCDLAEKLLGRPMPQAPAQFQLLSSGGSALEARRRSRFALDAASGRLTLAERLDRESIQHCLRAPASACQIDLTATFQPAEPAGSDVRLLDVSVTVEDVNDNAPAFPASARIRRWRLREHEPSARLRLPPAVDPDAGRNGTVRYRLARPSTLFVLEEDAAGAAAVELSAANYDGGVGGGGGQGHRAPVLRALREIDLESGDPATKELLGNDGFALVVQAWDDGEPPLAGDNLTVLLSVENTNDFDPEFEPSARNQLITIPENASLNSLLLRASATDRDFGSIGRLSYSLRSAELPQHLPFRIDPISGEIRLAQSLDAEDRQEYRFEVVVNDNHNPEPRTAAMSVTVRVEDVNDNPPSIEVISTSPSLGLSLPENQPAKLIGFLLVTDRDRDSRHQPPPRCDLAGFLHRTDAFELVPEPAVKAASNSREVLRLLLRSRRPLDREQVAEHHLRIECSDSGGLRTERRFMVRVLDENDSPPVFSTSGVDSGSGGSFAFRLVENLPAGASIGRAEARDPDEAAETVYSVMPPCNRLVGVGQRNGSLYTLAPLDRETNASLRCHLLAADAAKPELTAVAAVRIDVDDVNDCAPVFRHQLASGLVEDSDSVQRFRISEDARPGLTVGRIVADDADSGENGRVSFALLPAATPDESAGASAFRLTAAGELLLLSGLDRERRASHRLRVIARDHGRPSLTARTVVEIDVDDVNDNAPSFVFPPAGADATDAAVVNVSVRERPGASVARLSAVDPDAGDNGSVEYRIVYHQGVGRSSCSSGQFSLESDTGRLLLVRQPPHSSQLCALNVEAADRGSPPLRSSARLLINFTDIRPRGTSLLSGSPDGGGGVADGGPRDLVVVTVCVAVSFLVLLCVVTLAGYFCYYMQLRRSSAGDSSAAAGTIVDDFQGIGSHGTGSRSSVWLSRVSLGNGSSSGKRLKRPTTSIGWLRSGIGGNNCGDSLISHPIPIKTATEDPEAIQESHYTADRSRGTMARLASIDSRCQTLMTDCAAEQRSSRFRGRQQGLNGEYQALTAGGNCANTAFHWSADPDAKGSSGYKSLARPPPSAEPAQTLEQSAASVTIKTTAPSLSASVSMAAMQPQQQQQQQRNLGNSGYVYGSPYLTSSFV